MTTMMMMKLKPNAGRAEDIKFGQGELMQQAAATAPDAHRAHFLIEETQNMIYMYIILMIKRHFLIVILKYFLMRNPDYDPEVFPKCDPSRFSFK